MDRQQSLHNFQATDWEAFGNALSMRLNIIPDLAPILSEGDFTQAVSELVKALQDTIQAVVPKTHPSPYAKQWWNNELIALKKAKNKLSGLAYKYRALPGHPIHGEHRALWRKYSEGNYEGQTGSLLGVYRGFVIQGCLDRQQIHFKGWN